MMKRNSYTGNRPDKDLLPVKAHYFLRNAATGSLSLFLPLIVHQKGVPPETVGMIWTLLPFLTMVTNSASGSIADAFKIHKIVFISSLILLTLGSCSIYFLPPLEENGMTQSSQRGNHSVKNVSQPSLLLNLNFSSSIPTEADELHILQVKNETVKNANSSSHLDETFPSYKILSMYPFWLLFFCLLAHFIGLNISIIFSDAMCFKILGPERADEYGFQRMWGTIGMGVSASVIGGVVDWYSKGHAHKDFFPAFVICGVLMSCDVIVVSRIRFPTTHKEKLDWAVLAKLFRSAETIVFLVLVMVFGFATGVNWTFRLIMVEDVIEEYDPNFPATELLLGFLMTVETFGGELPFFYFSGRLINRLGHVIVIILCLVCLWGRYTLYFLLTNPWLFLLVEILNGPSYALLDLAIVSFGSRISPSGALATVQAIIRATFATGQSCGSLLGGILYQAKGGRKTFLTTGFIVLGFTAVYAAFQLRVKITSHSQNESESLGRSESSIHCTSTSLRNVPDKEAGYQYLPSKELENDREYQNPDSQI